MIFFVQDSIPICKSKSWNQLCLLGSREPALRKKKEKIMELSTEASLILVHILPLFGLVVQGKEGDKFLLRHLTFSIASLATQYKKQAKLSLFQGNFSFQFCRRWSRPHSWFPQRVPHDGDNVTVETSQLLLLDVNTSLLNSLHIKGLWSLNSK